MLGLGVTNQTWRPDKLGDCSCPRSTARTRATWSTVETNGVYGYDFTREMRPSASITTGAVSSGNERGPVAPRWLDHPLPSSGSRDRRR